MDVIKRPPSARAGSWIQETNRIAQESALLLDSITDYAIFMLDANGCVVSWNKGAERLKGYRADEIVGQHFSRFYAENDVVAGKPAMELEIAAREGRFEEEGWRVRKDNSLFWANVVITAIRDESGQVQGFSKVTRDITERHQAEERLSTDLRRSRNRNLSDHPGRKMPEREPGGSRDFWLRFSGRTNS